MLQLPEWRDNISNRDRVRILTSWHHGEGIPQKEDLVNFGLLATLDPKNPRDQEIVLQEIALLKFDNIPVENLLWTMKILSPYFANYNFAKDPVLVNHLWESSGDVSTTMSWWKLLDQLGVHLLEPIGTVELSTSPIFRDYSPQEIGVNDITGAMNGDDHDRTSLHSYVGTGYVGGALLEKAGQVYYFQFLPAEEFRELVQNSRAALSILFRQPYFRTESGVDFANTILSRAGMREMLGFAMDANIRDVFDTLLTFRDAAE